MGKRIPNFESHYIISISLTLSPLEALMDKIKQHQLLTELCTQQQSGFLFHTNPKNIKLTSPRTLRELASLKRINWVLTVSCPELVGTKQSQVAGSQGAACRGSFLRSDGGNSWGWGKRQWSHSADWGSGSRVAYFFCKVPDSKYFRVCGSHMVSVTFFPWPFKNVKPIFSSAVQIQAGAQTWTSCLSLLIPTINQSCSTELSKMVATSHTWLLSYIKSTQT